MFLQLGEEKNMMEKIVGIFVMMLLIVTSIPTFGMIGEIESSDNNELRDYFEEDYVSGELIVKFKEPPTSLVSINNLNEKYEVSSMEKLFVNSEDTILDNIYILRFSEDLDLLSIMNDYSKDPNVIYVELNGLAIPFLIPNDQDFDKQWYLDNTGQTGGKPDCDIDGPEAWDVMIGSPDIVIAIVDSGIDYTHPDLENNIWINEDEIPDNDIDDDNNGYVDDIRGWDFAYKDNDPKDLHGHGTACAGVVGGVADNGIGLAGVSWNSKIMIVQIANKKWVGYYTNIALGIQYAADNGADVISLSFGSYNQDYEIVKDAIDYAYDKGVVLFAAAGNDGTNNKPNPASLENVIAVAGTNNKDHRMDTFELEKECISNYGDWVDIAAPAENIYTTMPTYSVYMIEEYSVSMNYEFLSGTSAASPIAAGVAALLLSNNSELTQAEVKSIICEYSDSYISIYDLGEGRINAYRAIQKVKSMDYLNPWIFRLIQRFPIFEKILDQII